ncbi:hypothetical protein AFLA70_363g001092 [Aspergillus flavus AF70]|nr:hypothetical protein AFLA70_363g001092 [Aspergillus flavus AF70]
MFAWSGEGLQDYEAVLPKTLPFSKSTWLPYAPDLTEAKRLPLFPSAGFRFTQPPRFYRVVTYDLHKMTSTIEKFAQLETLWDKAIQSPAGGRPSR